MSVYRYGIKYDGVEHYLGTAPATGVPVEYPVGTSRGVLTGNGKTTKEWNGKALRGALKVGDTSKWDDTCVMKSDVDIIRQLVAAEGYDIITSGSGQWSPPPGVTAFTVYCIGAGSGGGGGNGSASYIQAGGGGAGGKIVSKAYSNQTMENSYDYSVGNGGGGGATGNPGGSGGSTSFDDITASGGTAATERYKGGSGGTGGGGGGHAYIYPPSDYALPGYNGGSNGGNGSGTYGGYGDSLSKYVNGSLYCGAGGGGAGAYQYWNEEYEEYRWACSNAGLGGSGGGGHGAGKIDGVEYGAESGAPNTGGGGGGGLSWFGSGASGGSGIIIIIW